MGGVFPFFGNCANAQITPDSTLPNNSNVTQVGNTSVINAGTQAGSNLFHSFGKFSIPTGGTAFFNNSTDIANIFSRVTGGSVSNIDGLIRANGNANLFLINPNGIIFGPNASLNIGGSFLASTASSLKFADGFEFSAKASQTTPLLTISVPVGLQFGSNPASIVNQSRATRLFENSGLTNPYKVVGLEVQPGKTLALIGGNITFEGGNVSIHTDFRKRGSVKRGTIELGSVGANSLVKLIPQEMGFAVNYEGIQKFGDIQLVQDAFILTSPGDIHVQGRDIQLHDSWIDATTGGDIQIQGRDIQVIKDSLIFTGSGNIWVQGQDIQLSQNSTISSQFKNIQVQGRNIRVSQSTIDVTGGGDLTIDASESVELTGTISRSFRPDSPYIPSRIAVGYDSKGGGNLLINTKRLTVRDGAQIQAFIQGPLLGTFPVSGGETFTFTTSVARSVLAGTLTVNATESVEVIGTAKFSNGEVFPSQIIAASGSVSGSKFVFNISGIGIPEIGIIGPGGNLAIQTGELIVKDGGQISVNSRTSGNAGNLKIAARSIFLNNEGKLTAISENARGGNIELQVKDELLMRGNSLISAESGITTGSTDGNIKIDAGVIAAIPSENSDIIARAERGGNIDIKTKGGIFGIQFQEQLTPESDITGSGSVTFNIPDRDPSRGLVELPINLVDTSQQIDTSCNPGSKQRASSFVITGRGSLPPNPSDTLTPDAVLVDWVTLNPNIDNRKSPSVTTKPTTNAPERIVEATGWVRNSKGEVFLTANAPTTPNGSWQKPVSCRAS
jgi:filamentous hemagglutinin family protein